MNFEKVYRHGDVIIFKLKEKKLPKYTSKKMKKVVLAYGEVTGHSHQLTGDLEVMEANLDQDEMMFRLQSPGVLRHEEHDQIVLEPGIYLKVNQVEYDPFQDLLVNIRD